ncbi:MAG TPA: peptidoglycan-binding domain-containing protein [Bryobacteraceae bacterium]|nr:peptidoglycan-binding domain-containing protein [Bryobacteraceae bacterium]
MSEEKYIVSLGDSIPSLAHDNGHFWETLWNHGENAELKAKRKNPNILAPGDEVHIPPIRVQDFQGGTDMRHKFVRKGIPAKLKMQLFLLGEPRRNEPYTLILDDEMIKGTTDGDGNLEQFVRPNSKGGVLRLNGGKEEYPVRVGYLNPIDRISGVKQRLNNLGFYCGNESEDEDDLFAQALTQFQGEHGVPQTGQNDAVTRAKIESLHT